MSISAREGATRASQDVLLVIERETEIELLIGKDASRRCAHRKRIVGPRVQWRDATDTLKKSFPANVGYFGMMVCQNCCLREKT